MRVALGRAIGVAAVLVVGRAGADEHAKAVELFRHARALIDKGECASAIPLLAESAQREPSVGAELSLADCYEPTDPLQAWRQVKEAERLALDRHDARLDNVTRRADRLATRLPTVRIAVPPSQNLPGLVVRLDGVRLDESLYLRGPIATTPGSHLVDATVGEKRWSASIDARAGQPATVTIELRAPVAEPPPAPPPPTPVPPVLSPPPPVAPVMPPPVIDATGSPASPWRTLGLVIGGVGVAGLVLGTIGGFEAIGARNSVIDACRGPSGQGTVSTCMAPVSQSGEVSSAHTWATVSTTGLVAGGALAATGAVLALAGGGRRQTASPSHRLTPVVIAQPGLFGGSIVGAW
jgi:hypothetical protein